MTATHIWLWAEQSVNEARQTENSLKNTTLNMYRLRVDWAKVVFDWMLLAFIGYVSWKVIRYFAQQTPGDPEDKEVLNRRIHFQGKRSNFRMSFGAAVRRGGAFGVPTKASSSPRRAAPRRAMARHGNVILLYVKCSRLSFQRWRGQVCRCVTAPQDMNITWVTPALIKLCSAQEQPIFIAK